MHPALKPCAFCASPAKDVGGWARDTKVDAVTCSKDGCIASFKSVSVDVWNTRPGAPVREVKADAALLAFEDSVRAEDIRGLMPEYYLKKLRSHDAANPEFLDRMVDHDWQLFRKAWLACMAYHSA